MAEGASMDECPFDGERIRRSEYAGDARYAAIYNVAPILPGHSLSRARGLAAADRDRG